MSCVPVTPAMATLLEVLRDWPEVDTTEMRQTPEWEQARTWGWIMESGEMTGSGSRHVHDLPGGIVVD